MRAILATILIAVALATTGAVSAKAADPVKDFFDGITRNGAGG